MYDIRVSACADQSTLHFELLRTRDARPPRSRIIGTTHTTSITFSLPLPDLTSCTSSTSSAQRDAVVGRFHSPRNQEKFMQRHIPNSCVTSCLKCSRAPLKMLACRHVILLTCTAGEKWSGQCICLHATKDMGEHCKLPSRGLGRSPRSRHFSTCEFVSAKYVMYAQCSVMYVQCRIT